MDTGEKLHLSTHNTTPQGWQELQNMSILPEDNTRVLGNILSSIDINEDMGFLGKKAALNQLYNEIVKLPNNNFDVDEKNKCVLEVLNFLNDGLQSKNRNEVILTNYDKRKNDPALIDKIEEYRNKLDRGGWLSVRSPELKNDKNAEYIKLYLSVDNGNLHCFAREMLDLLIAEKRTDIDFKINNDEETNRRDNVVIYCNKKNFTYYSRVIGKLVQHFDEDAFNPPHPLGFYLSRNIRCGLDKGDTTSFTEAMCERIIDRMCNGESAEDIEVAISNYQSKYDGFATISEAIMLEDGFKNLSSPSYLIK